MPDRCRVPFSNFIGGAGIYLACARAALRRQIVSTKTYVTPIAPFVGDHQLADDSSVFIFG